MDSQRKNQGCEGSAFLVDFSLKEIESAKRSGPKSSAQTPAKPSERRKGSSKNKPGSASSKSEKAQRMNPDSMDGGRWTATTRTG